MNGPTGAGRRDRRAAPRGQAVHRCCSTTRIIARSATRRRCGGYDLSGYDGVLAFGAALARRLSRAAAGAAGSSSGTRPRISALSTRRAVERRAQGHRCGSATGATASAARSCDEFLLRPAARWASDARRPRRALSGGGARRCWPAPARDIAAGCRTPRRRRCSRGIGSPSTCRAASTPRTCRASPPSACSKRWPAAFRWSAHPGTTARACFTPGQDFLSRATATRCGPTCARAAAMTWPCGARWPRSGLAAIHARHTCAHRVDELLAIVTRLSSHAEAA